MLDPATEDTSSPPELMWRVALDWGGLAWVAEVTPEHPSKAPRGH